MVGAVLTGRLAVTLKWKNVEVIRMPSLTLIVTSASPTCPGKGVSVTVRLAALPPNTIPASDNTRGLEDEAVSPKLAAGVSTSPTVKGMGEVAVSVVVV